MNDAKGCPESDPKTVTHTSDGKKIKLTDTSNIVLQKKMLINQTLTIFTMTMDPRIENMIATCGGTPHTFATPTTKKVITNAALRSMRVKCTPRHR